MMTNGLRFLALAAFLGSLAAIPAGQAIGDAGTLTNCGPTFAVTTVGGLFSAGTIDFCLYAPQVVHGHTASGSDDTVRMTAIVAGPPGTTPVFTYTTTIISGCSISSTTQQDTIGAFGSMSTAHWNLDVWDGANQCHGAIQLTITAGLASTQVYRAYLPWMIQTEGFEVDNLNRLCAASAVNTTCTTPELNVDATNRLCAASALGTSCTTPSVNVPDLAAALEELTDALCNNPSGHGHCSLDIHGGLSLEQDGTWTVRVENFTADVDIGNQSVSFPSNLTVAASFPGDVDAPGFDFWALFIFWVFLLGFCLYQGWYFAAAFAIPGVLDAMFPAQIPENFSVWFVFVLLGCIMEVAAMKFQWGPYKSRNGMRA